MKSFEKKCLLSTYIPGECHIASIVGNNISDPIIFGNEFIKFKNLYEKYGKVFSSNTRIMIEMEGDAKYVADSTCAGKETKELIIKENFIEAIHVLKPYIRDDETTIEILYNYAICLKEINEIYCQCVDF